MTISEILSKLSAELVQGDLDTTVLGFASLADAKHGDLSFFGDARYASALEHTLASVILVPVGWQKMPLDAVCIAVADPSSAFNLLVAGADREMNEFPFGIHPTAVVSDDVSMDSTRVHIGAKAVVESGARIGDGSVIGPGCFVGRNVVMGEGCRLYPNVTIYDRCILGNRVAIHSGAVIGADGFGYRTEKGTHLKVAQNGIVQIDDDVEIGANTTIDRARIGKTWIGEGTKIDNLVQVGHNVVIGKHCMMISQSGIAGSTSLGDHVVVAAQAGIVGHVSVGSRNIIGARAVVTKSLPDDGGVYLGFPAVPAMQERRRMVASKGVQGFSDRLKKMENQMRPPASDGE